jgi:hypothetical protein
VLTPRLSSLWIHLVTPADHRIARPLAEGLRNRVVCRDDRAQQLMPCRLLSVEEAIRAALGKTRDGDPETSWLDAGSLPGDPDWTGGTVYLEKRVRTVAATPARVYAVVTRIGGAHGWYASQWLWRLRGALDRLVGGPGLSRGRRHADTLAYGDVVDFWRVTGLEPDRRLELRAEMRLPGEASLEFLLEEGPQPGSCRLHQTARFKPRGLLGILYWYAVTPFHRAVFDGMIRAIARQAVVNTP